MLDVEKLLDTLDKYHHDAARWMDDAAERGGMHSAEWYYYKGLTQAFARAKDELIKASRED